MPSGGALGAASSLSLRLPNKQIHHYSVSVRIRNFTISFMFRIPENRISQGTEFSVSVSVLFSWKFEVSAWLAQTRWSADLGKPGRMLVLLFFISVVKKHSRNQSTTLWRLLSNILLSSAQKTTLSLQNPSWLTIIGKNDSKKIKSFWLNRFNRLNPNCHGNYQHTTHHNPH